ncbi:RagB/SusD family nutrient uptake outer membrane protein [Arachidicoccus terrestris]|uniref:RagB/SusD family nutrient uptake outer membrane protein n=1 Tax=Arachidicoccus terrestris TaxID=2875539 RepID=UPI001CC82143|nr:RagB/SusD family nutrient uptake outer membrane protein [Arachidicoccus terrestris]UAY53793.1 RagB/SusD family nutrient uptake outer membrane protein [Arachidicoccus terrestris]
MKKILSNKKLLFFGVMILMMASCKKELNVPPSDLLGSEGFYQTPAQCEQGIIGIYGNLRNLSSDEYLYMSEARSDNAWVTPISNGLREYVEIATFRAGNDISTFNNIWNEWYRVIFNANGALARIPDCDFGTNELLKKQLLGEAHFLRGWAYFELARLFGNVPLIDKQMLPAEVNTVPQSSASDIINKIAIPDLKSAIDQLPVADQMVDNTGKTIAKSGRADKIAAQAMLGRVYMTLAGFPFNDNSAVSEAETQLKAVIDYSNANGNKYWAPDSTEWRKQFMPTGDYYNKYSIFAIQYRTGGSGNPAIFNFSPALPPTYTDQRIFGNSIFVEKTLMYQFDRVYGTGASAHHDARGLGYSVLTGFDAEKNFPAYTQTTDTLHLPDGSVVDELTSSMFYKFMPSKRKIAALGMSLDAEAEMKDHDDWGVNLPIIRLEDVMLMYAEILSKANPAGAMAIVNKIRQRAGCSVETASSSAQALQYVKEERRIELMGEGVRWFDLVRWNEWKSATIEKFNRYNNPDGTDIANVRDGRYLYPIPLSQMQVKPGLYTQNTGY